MVPFAKVLILFGALSMVAGFLILFASKNPFLGRLPGDIHIERENFSIYFPLASSLIISLLVSLLFWLFRR